MKKTIAIFVLLVCTGATICFSQDESLIKGKIIDKNSGEPQPRLSGRTAS